MRRPAHLMIALGAAGAAGVLGAMACWWYDPKALTFTRGVVINGLWVPRGAMVAWVLGATAASLAVAWWLTEVVRLRLRWLVVLGRTALALYVIHQLLVVNLVQRALGVRLARWGEFWAATAGLIAALVVIGMAWLAARSVARRERRRWQAPAAARPVEP